MSVEKILNEENEEIGDMDDADDMDDEIVGGGKKQKTSEK